MALHEETVDGPGTVAKAIEERWQGRERLSVLTDLPTRKAEAPGRAFEAKELAVLTFRVDRRARRAKQPRKIVRTQHVRVAENFGDTPPAPLARRRERPIEIRIGDLWRSIDDRESEAELISLIFSAPFGPTSTIRRKAFPVLCIRSSAAPNELNELPYPLAVARQCPDCLGCDRDRRSGGGIAVEHKDAAPGDAIAAIFTVPASRTSPWRSAWHSPRARIWGAALRSSSS